MAPIDVTKSRGEFFKILAGTRLSQIGIMTIRSGGDSGPEEAHEGDQIVYLIEGEADMEIDSERYHMVSGMVAIIPARARHHIYNRGFRDLFILTIYAPPAY